MRARCLFIFIASFCLALGSSLAAESRIAKIVVLSGVTSSARSAELVQGTRMALEEFNQRGGALPGLKVELELMALPSDRGNSSMGAFASALVEDESVLATLWGPDAPPTFAALTVLAEADMPAMLPFDSDRSLTHFDLRNVFRMCPNDDDQAEESALFALRTLRKRKVVVVHDNSDRGRQQAERFRDTLRAKGVREQAFLVVPEGHTDSEADAFKAKLRAVGPNLIYFGGGVEPAAWVMEKVKEAKLQVSVMGSDLLFRDAFISQAGDACLGAIVSSSLINLRKARSAQLRDFAKRYRKAYGTSAMFYAAPGYDTGRLLLTALGKAGAADRSALRKTVAASAAKALVLPVMFDANGDNQKRKVHFYVIHRNSDTKNIEFVFRMEP
jgi:branched-chain amino acid transport system substrate-binding protein